MKKFLAIILSAVLLCQPGITIFAEENTEETPENSICSTGSLEMNDEQLDFFKNEIPMIVSVKPNQLFIERFKR